jgi:hypothetical protein
MTDEEEEPESLIIPYEGSSILLYRAPSIREKQTVRRCVEQLAAMFKELIVEDEDLELCLESCGGNTTNIIRNLGKGQWLRKGRNFDVVLWDEGTGLHNFRSYFQK